MSPQQTMNDKPLHTIKLTYDIAKGTVTSEPAFIEMEKDSKLEFVSGTDPVRVMIPGKLFSAAEFRTGDDPVTANRKGKFKYCCGVKIKGKVYGYPLNRDSGNDGEIITPTLTTGR